MKRGVVWFIALALVFTASARGIEDKARALVAPTDIRGAEAPKPLASPKGYAVFFAATDCPMSRFYWARFITVANEYRRKGIEFYFVFSNPDENTDQVLDWAKRQGAAEGKSEHVPVPFPVILDEDQSLAKSLGADTKSEIVLLNASFDLYYHGAFDGQLSLEDVTGLKRRPEAPADSHYFVTALNDLLSGKAATAKPYVKVEACPITFVDPASRTKITYWKHIKPILDKHCAACHLPGQVAGHLLDVSSYDALENQIGTLRRRVVSRTMPPWFADPTIGKFSNERRLSNREVRLIDQWVKSGHPEGEPDPSDLVIEGKQYPSRESYEEALENWIEKKKTHTWVIGKPDAAFAMRTPFKLPKTGIIDYQYIGDNALGKVENPEAGRVAWNFSPTAFDHDVWVTQSQIIPAVTSAVHHVIVYVMRSDADELNNQQESFVAKLVSGSLLQRMMTFRRFKLTNRDSLQWGDMLYGVDGNKLSWEIGRFVPGESLTTFPEGYAAKIPKGGRLLFEMHYTPDGEEHPEGDQTIIGVKWTTTPPKYEVTTLPMGVIVGIDIPPHTKGHRIVKEYQFDHAVNLIGLRPHGHLAARSFVYEAVYPNGNVEKLLSVPKYSFEDQPNYQFKEPKRLPAGTTLRLMGIYDNDGDEPLYFGQQTSEEMFFGYVSFANAEETKP